jgi:predicted O-methyltransferase YrrM
MEHINENFIGWFTFTRLYKDMVNKFPSGSSMVEVGCYEGKSFSYLIVEMINANKNFNLFCVDSFTFENLLDKFKSNMEPLDGKFTAIIGDSSKSADVFADKSLDFVFLDADHVYERIKGDTLAWLPKIKPGGILAGHDFECEEHPGVLQAVTEIFGDKVCRDYVDEKCWMVKL